MIKLLHLKLATELNCKRTRTGSQVGIQIQTYKPYLQSFLESHLKPSHLNRKTQNGARGQIKILKHNSANIVELAHSRNQKEQRTNSIKELLQR